jgi:hypothetical protein
MQYLPGRTVQCLNTSCSARGQWLRVETKTEESCANCGAQLQNVPPPLAPASHWPVTAQWDAGAKLPTALSSDLLEVPIKAGSSNP